MGGLWHCFTPMILPIPGRCGTIWPHSFPLESWLLTWNVAGWRSTVEDLRDLRDSRWMVIASIPHDLFGAPKDILTQSYVKSDEKDRFT